MLCCYKLLFCVPVGSSPLTVEMLEPLVILLKCQDVTVQRPASRAVSNFALLGPGESERTSQSEEEKEGERGRKSERGERGRLGVRR